MNMEDILIEGFGGGRAFGDIIEGELDISGADESLVNQVYVLRIYKTNEDLERIEEIGTIEMNYMDVIMAEETGIGIFTLFDLIDSEKQGVYHYLYGNGERNMEYVGMDSDVIYIDKIFIEKKYRNKGIGGAILRELPNLIRNVLKLRPGCLVLLANPFDYKGKEFVAERDENKREKLIKFYEKNGFTRIKDTQYLVVNMDYR